MTNPKPRQTPSAYDTRFKHKLNMLEPGSKMLAAAAVLFGLGCLCGLFAWQVGRRILFACAAVIVLVLMVLVAIELRQDRILNQIAEEERKNRKDA